MPVLQVPFEIPEEIAKKLVDGELIRYGGVIRNAAGEIVLHLDEIDGAQIVEKVVKPDSPIVAAGKKAINVVKENKVVFIGLGIAVVGAGAAYLIHKSKNKKKKKTPEEEREQTIHDNWQKLMNKRTEELQENSDSYNVTLNKYFKALAEKSMDVHIIRDLRNQIESLLQGLEQGDFEIQFATTNMIALANIFQNYGNELRKQNGFEVTESKDVEKLDSKSLVRYMIQKLKEQEQVFVEVESTDIENSPSLIAQ